MDRHQQGVTQVARAEEAEDMRGRESERNKITVPQGNVIHNQTGQEWVPDRSDTRATSTASK